MYSYTPNFIPSNVFVIGAGGTGSRLMPMLSQFLRSITRGKSPQGWVEDPTVWLIDDDTVELKNLLRQNFIASDVGKAKAAVVAERYSRAYEVNIVPIVTRIESGTAQDFYTTILENLNLKNPAMQFNMNGVMDILANSVVIICVDSAEARRDILNVFIRQNGRTSNRTFFIDAGNEDSFGQVSFFTPHIMVGKSDYDNRHEDLKVPKLVPFINPVDYVPMDANYYIGLRDTESTASCADLNQTLAINSLMATNIMGIVQNFFYRKPMTFHCLRTSLDGGNSTDYNIFRNFYNMTLNGSTSRNSTEKNGRVKVLEFLRQANQLSVCGVADVVVSKFEEERRKKREEEAAKAREIALATKLAERARLRELAKERFEAALQVEAAKEAALIAAANAVANAVVPTLDVVVQTSPVIEVSAEAVNVPPALVRTPRTRSRTVVELPMPVEVSYAAVEALYAEEADEEYSEAADDQF